MESQKKRGDENENEDLFLTPRDLLAFYPYKDNKMDKRINEILEDKWDDFKISGLIEKIKDELKIENADKLFKKIVCRVIGVMCETHKNEGKKGGGRKKKGGARREYNDKELHSIVSLLIEDPKNIIVFVMSVFIFVVGAYYLTLTANTTISYGTVSSSNNNALSMKLEKAIVVYNDPAVNDKSIVIVNKPLFDDNDLSIQKQQQSEITLSDLLYASITWSGHEIVNNIIENTKQLMAEKGQETINELVTEFDDQVKIGSYMKFIKNQGLENTDKPPSGNFKDLKDDFLKKIAQTTLVERIFHYYRFSFVGSMSELMTIMNHDLRKFKNRAALKVGEELDDSLFNIQLEVSKVIKDGTTGFRMMGISLMMMFGLYMALKKERDRLNTKIENAKIMAELDDELEKKNQALEKKNQALERMEDMLKIALNNVKPFIPAIMTRGVSERTKRLDDRKTGGGSKKRNRRRKRRKRTRRKSKKRKRKRKRKKTRRKRRR